LIAPQSAPRETPPTTNSTFRPSAPTVAPPSNVIERTTIVSLPPEIQPALAPTPERIVIERPALVEPQPAAKASQPAPAPQIVAQPPAAQAARDPQPAPARAPLIMPQPSITVIQARPALPAASQPTAAPSEPIIHVTIGRIEVRATPAPAPAARPKSAPTSATSLDEYLRQRNGGRR
jgi:hypothetical protein